MCGAVCVQRVQLAVLINLSLRYVCPREAEYLSLEDIRGNVLFNNGITKKGLLQFKWSHGGVVVTDY